MTVTNGRRTEYSNLEIVKENLFEEMVKEKKTGYRKVLRKNKLPAKIEACLEAILQEAKHRSKNKNKK